MDGQAGLVPYAGVETLAVRLGILQGRGLGLGAELYLLATTGGRVRSPSTVATQKVKVTGPSLVCRARVSR